MVRSKYGAKRVEIDGIKFDSKIEGEYYKYLKSNKDVIDIECHPTFLLQEGFKYNGESIRPINYEADFGVTYRDRKEVIDIKGQPTTDAKIKRKLFLYKYPDIIFKWLVRYGGERVDYFDNEKRKRNNKKVLQLKQKTV